MNDLLAAVVAQWELDQECACDLCVQVARLARVLALSEDTAVA